MKVGEHMCSEWFKRGYIGSSFTIMILTTVLLLKGAFKGFEVLSVRTRKQFVCIVVSLTDGYLFT